MVCSKLQSMKDKVGHEIFTSSNEPNISHHVSVANIDLWGVSLKAYTITKGIMPLIAHIHMRFYTIMSLKLWTKEFLALYFMYTLISLPSDNHIA